jgi:serine/threonine protein kinase
MLQTSAKSSLPPDAIGDYRIVGALSGSAYRALGPGDQKVVLKLLDADCLQRGKLHAGIHTRLSRVRELAHPGVANLHSVEKDGQYVFAVWDEVEGLPIDRYVHTRKPSPPSLARLARELILVVESLHNLGLVHGRITPGNVIVDSRGNVRLTHLSPLLYDDPAVDNSATMELLRDLSHAEGGEALAAALDVESSTLRTIAARLSVSVDALAKDEDHAVDSDTGVRWATVALAISLALLGVAVAWWIYKTVAT